MGNTRRICPPRCPKRRLGAHGEKPRAERGMDGSMCLLFHYPSVRPTEQQQESAPVELERGRARPHDNGFGRTWRAISECYKLGMLRLPTGVCAIADFGLDEGFETDTLAVVSEQDILATAWCAASAASARTISHRGTSLSVGDHVVHVEHGIGRFEGLQTIDVDGAPHDCRHSSTTRMRGVLAGRKY